MSALSPGMQAALEQDTVTVFGAVKISLSGGDICLLDGSGVVDFGGDRYRGADPVFGVLAGVSRLSDGAGNEAPRCTLTLFPSSTAAAADISDPAEQGAAVLISAGVVDRATGAVVADPYGVALMALDVPRIRISRGDESGSTVRSLEYDLVGLFDAARDEDEGTLLNGAWLQSLTPGAKGLDNVYKLRRDDGWGIGDDNVGGPSGSVGGGRSSKPERSPWGNAGKLVHH